MACSARTKPKPESKSHRDPGVSISVSVRFGFETDKLQPRGTAAYRFEFGCFFGSGFRLFPIFSVPVQAIAGISVQGRTRRRRPRTVASVLPAGVIYK